MTFTTVWLTTRTTVSIRTAKEIVCDACRCSERLDEPTVRAEWPSLSRSGWTRKRGKHFCPKCSPSRTPNVRHPVEFENADLGEEG